MPHKMIEHIEQSPNGDDYREKLVAAEHGLRGDTSIEKRVQYDIWYIENWSLWLDIKILFMTVFGGMKNSENIS